VRKKRWRGQDVEKKLKTRHTYEKAPLPLKTLLRQGVGKNQKKSKGTEKESGSLVEKGLLP